jgi:hypothetical protein
MKGFYYKFRDSINNIYGSILFKNDMLIYNSDILDIISVIHIVIRIELNK